MGETRSHQKEAAMSANRLAAPALSRRSMMKLAALLSAAALAPATLAGCDNTDDALVLTATDLTAPAREAASFSISGEDPYAILTDKQAKSAS